MIVGGWWLKKSKSTGETKSLIVDCWLLNVDCCFLCVVSSFQMVFKNRENFWLGFRWDHFQSKALSSTALLHYIYLFDSAQTQVLWSAETGNHSPLETLLATLLKTLRDTAVPFFFRRWLHGRWGRRYKTTWFLEGFRTTYSPLVAGRSQDGAQTEPGRSSEKKSDSQSRRFPKNLS